MAEGDVPSQKDDKECEESERALEELRQKVKKLMKDLKEVEKQRKEAEKQLARTTLPQYLSACHEHMQAKLNVEAFDWSNEDDLYNPRQKKRPNHIHEWPDFDSRQLKIWNELASSHIMTEKHFLSLHGRPGWRGVPFRATLASHGYHHGQMHAIRL